MLLSFENFKKVRQTVDELLKPGFTKDPKEHLVDVLKEIDEGQEREFLQQFSSLLLNVILNRRKEVGEQLIEKVKEYRRVVASWDRNKVAH